MEAIMSYLREFHVWTVVIRVVLAALAGALVGFERSAHGRAAGIRTHMTVSVGAALTVMIGLFAVNTLGVSSDPLRVAAQVVSGVGFLGAGTIFGATVIPEFGIGVFKTSAGAFILLGILMGVFNLVYQTVMNKKKHKLLAALATKTEEVA